jgi:Zn ribbon nucleic-acid-binding protein
MKKCPKCKSSNIKVEESDGISFVTCNVCDYDELEEFYPEVRKSQREKAKFSPYKTGGKGRSRK